jgi:hypothetical protein
MRPFASKDPTLRAMREPPQNHCATDCDCEGLEKTGICVWFCVWLYSTDFDSSPAAIYDSRTPAMLRPHLPAEV